MLRYLVFCFTLFFLFGCSSLNNSKQVKRWEGKGFNIIKYNDDTSSASEGVDDFYEKIAQKPKRGFNVRYFDNKNIVSMASGMSVKKILIKKSKRKMYVFKSDGQVKEYLVSLGKSPVGKKLKVGDGKTPEGSYDIEYHNPRSQFFYSLKISYPNKADLESARERRVNPGGDIFIHGLPNKDPRYINFVKRDWTNGCIAVSNEAIKEIASMVKKGTPITIEP